MITLDDVKNIISQFGPTMLLHSGEKYLMDSPEPFLDTALSPLSYGLVYNEDDYDTFYETGVLTTPVKSGLTLLDAVAIAKQDPRSGDPHFRCWLQVADALKGGNMGRAKAQIAIKKGINDDMVDIQFWFFYGFNGPGKFRITVGDLPPHYVYMDTCGRHYGDWEHVTLRVARNGTGWLLKNVYLSRHSFTIWVNELSKLQFQNGHPLIYVAQNSHAHYETAEGDDDGRHYYLRPWSFDFKIGTAAVDLFDITDGNGVRFDTSQTSNYEFIYSEYPEHNITPPAWADYGSRWGQYEKLEYMIHIPVVDKDEGYKEVGSGPIGPLAKNLGFELRDEWASSNMGQGPEAGAWLTGEFGPENMTEIVQTWDNDGTLGFNIYSTDFQGGLQNSWTNGSMGEGSGAVTWLTGDFNGDGKDEIVQGWDNGNLGFVMYGSDGNGGLRELWKGPDMGNGPGAIGWFTGDFNGDGRSEIIQAWDNGNLGLVMYGSDGMGGLKQLWKSEDMGEGPEAVTWLTGDFNGDGNTELVQGWDNGNLGMIMYGSDGAGGLKELWKGEDMGEGPGAVTWLVADYNADGMDEIVQGWDNGNLGFVMYGSDGSGGLKELWRSGDMGEGPEAVAWLTGDFNADGNTEIVQCWDNGNLGMIVYGSDDNGGLKELWKGENINEGPEAVAWLTGDFAGNGISEIVQGWNSDGNLGLIMYSKATE